MRTALTVNLRELQQQEQGIADGGADRGRARKQQVSDGHQQVLLREFCVSVSLLLGEARSQRAQREGRLQGARYGVACRVAREGFVTEFK